VIRIKNLHKTIGRQKVLRGVDLEIHDGEKLVVIGTSGGGKSVLLKHILGLMQPDSGEVWYGDREVTRMSELELIPLRRELGMVFQNGALFDSMSVGENVGFSLIEQQRLPAAEVKKKVAEALAMVGLKGQENKWPSDLSGGMRKRTALARAAVSYPRVMLYDEPTAGLDPIMADSIDKLILRLCAEQGSTAVVVTHDMKSVYTIADRIAMLHEGRIYTILTPKEIQASQDPIIHRFINGISDDEVTQSPG
jgi:phospholipid/cholesterol/gamma-HCH transport system ATP-binding protein